MLPPLRSRILPEKIVIALIIYTIIALFLFPSLKLINLLILILVLGYSLLKIFGPKTLAEMLKKAKKIPPPFLFALILVTFAAYLLFVLSLKNFALPILLLLLIFSVSKAFEVTKKFPFIEKLSKSLLERTREIPNLLVQWLGKFIPIIRFIDQELNKSLRWLIPILARASQRAHQGLAYLKIILPKIAVQASRKTWNVLKIVARVLGRFLRWFVRVAAKVGRRVSTALVNIATQLVHKTRIFLKWLLQLAAKIGQKAYQGLAYLKIILPKAAAQASRKTWNALKIVGRTLGKFLKWLVPVATKVGQRVLHVLVKITVKAVQKTRVFLRWLLPLLAKAGQQAYQGLVKSAKWIYSYLKIVLPKAAAKLFQTAKVLFKLAAQGLDKFLRWLLPLITRAAQKVSQVLGFLWQQLERILEKVPARSDMSFVIFFTIMADIFIILPLFNKTFLRVLFSLPLLLFLPGYSAVSSLFPRKEDITIVERLGLALGLSIIITVFTSFFLSSTAQGLRAVPLTLTLSLLTFLFLALTQIRRNQTGSQEQFLLSYDKISNILKSREEITPVEKALVISFIFSIIAVIIILGYARLTFPDEKFTELYILDKNGKVKDYPTELYLGKPDSIKVGIKNHEGKDINYTLKVFLEGDLLDSIKIPVKDASTWMEDLYFIPDRVGTNLKLDFLLYKGNPKEIPYRSTHLWVSSNFGEPDKMVLSTKLPVITNGDMESSQGWNYSSNNANFLGNYTSEIFSSKYHSYEIIYPRMAPSKQGDYGAIYQDIRSEETTSVLLSFSVMHSFNEEGVKGYHFKQVLLNEKVIWEDDVQGNEGWQNIKIPITLDAGINRLILRVYEKQGVSDYPVTVWWDDVKIESPAGAGTWSPPKISNVTHYVTGRTSALITWNTDQLDSNNRVYYSTDLISWNWSYFDIRTNKPNILLRSLAPNTTYYYTVWSYNGTYSAYSSNSSINNFTTEASFDNKPMITFTFGGVLGTYKFAKDVLADSKIKGVAYISTESIGVPWMMDWGQIKSLQNDYGWEIGSSGLFSVDLTTLNDSNLDYELKESKRILESNNLSIKSFATPYGSFNNKVLVSIARYYNSHRAGWGVEGDYNINPFNEYSLNVIEVPGDIPASTLKRRIDDATANKTWLILVFPEINKGNLANFEAIAKYIGEQVALGKIEVVTVTEGLTNTRRPVPPEEQPSSPPLVIVEAYVGKYKDNEDETYISIGFEGQSFRVDKKRNAVAFYNLHASKTFRNVKRVQITRDGKIIINGVYTGYNIWGSI